MKRRDILMLSRLILFVRRYEYESKKKELKHMGRMMPGLIDDVKKADEIQEEVEQISEHLKMREYISYLMHENKKLKKRVEKLEKKLKK